MHSSKGLYYALHGSQHETVQFTHSGADTCLQHTVELCVAAGEWLFIGHYVAAVLGSMLLLHQTSCCCYGVQHVAAGERTQLLHTCNPL